MKNFGEKRTKKNIEKKLSSRTLTFCLIIGLVGEECPYPIMRTQIIAIYLASYGQTNDGLIPPMKLRLVSDTKESN